MSAFKLDVGTGGTELIDSPIDIALRRTGFAPAAGVSKSAAAALQPQASAQDETAPVSCTDALAICMRDSALGG